MLINIALRIKRDEKLEKQTKNHISDQDVKVNGKSYSLLSIKNTLKNFTAIP